MSNLFDKIEDLGGVKYISNEDLKSSIDKDLSIVNSIMGKIPDIDIIEFITKFGNSRFIKDVYAKNNIKSGFLQSGEIEIGTIFGWGGSKKSIPSVINQYFSPDQITDKFFPLFEGYPGDIIYYSLEEDSFGNIYYWYHESDNDEDDYFLADTLHDFIVNFFIKVDDDSDEIPLSDDELEQINMKRKKVGLPPIDKFKNIV